MSASRCVCVRRINIGGEGNALHTVLSSLHFFAHFELIFAAVDKLQSQSVVCQLGKHADILPATRAM